MINVVQSVKGYFDERREKNESEKNMKQDLQTLSRLFDTLSFDDQRGILSIADFLIEDAGVVDVTLDNPTIKEIVSILKSLPRKELITTYKLLSQRMKSQEELASALLPVTEYEDAPEDENEHAFG